MTLNQFHGRNLVTTDRSPASPNAETRRRRPKPPPGPAAAARWSISGVMSSHQTDVLLHNLSLSRFDSLTWLENGVTTQGKQYVFFVIWDGNSPQLTVGLDVDYGAGFVVVQTVNDPNYLGLQPYDSGVLAWTAASGIWEIGLSGLWQP